MVGQPAQNQANQAGRRPRWKVILPGRVRAMPRWALLGAVATLLVLLALAVRLATFQAPPAVPTSDVAAAPKLVARGQVKPVAQARVGTLSGGVVYQIAVELGQTVEEQQVIARVRGQNGTEVLTAPRTGTIASIPVQVGDTLLPGAIIAIVADLSRLRVETTDLDEFLIGHVRKGQAVKVTIDALNRRDLRGRVRTVAVQPERSSDGDEHYPIVIDLEEPAPGLRPGMTARVDFSP